MSTSTLDGWAKLKPVRGPFGRLQPTKFHFFAEGRSLCSKVIHLGDVSPTKPAAGDACVKCMLRFSKHREGR